jgi:hypothetical protein
MQNQDGQDWRDGHDNNKRKKLRKRFVFVPVSPALIQNFQLGIVKPRPTLYNYFVSVKQMLVTPQVDFLIGVAQKKGGSMNRMISASLFAILVFLGCTKNPASTVPPHTTQVSSADSLFTVLVARVQTLSKASSYDQVVGVTFNDLRDGFNDIISQDDTNQKANVGYIVSAILSLNTDPVIRRMADSLDAYFRALDSSNSVSVMGPTLNKEGVLGLGKVIGVRTKDIVLAQTKKPSFPAFVTMSYIQSAIESELLPVLDNVIAAAVRLENRSETSVLVVVTDNGSTDSAIINKGEIYLVDAYMHLLSAFGNWLCAYNYDLYAPGTTNNSWIDSLANSNGYTNPTVYSLSNDTLIQCSKDYVSSSDLYMVRMMQYNLQRQGFLTIRSANQGKIKADLLAAPALIKTGITSIRNETGSQQYDIVKISNILDMDKDMVNNAQNLINEGVSPALAAKFSSPESLMDFITQLLSGPYSFDETIDSAHIALTVNISAFFDHPVSDLRSLLPKYRWLDESQWVSGEEDFRYVSTMPSNTVVTYQGNDTVVIPSSQIDSIVPNAFGNIVYYLKQPYKAAVTIDSTWSLNNPLRLMDGNNADMNVDSLTKAKSFFPYFTDYTFDGIFPDMTRQKWLDLIYQ